VTVSRECSLNAGRSSSASTFSHFEQQEVEVAPVEEHVALRGYAAYRG
jgi:hypothetical protein